jgi:tRNA pseudouridine55 synthase
LIHEAFLPFKAGSRWQAGLALVHKPVGVTSHTVVRAAMESMSADRSLKVCHSGTLDPFAEGLLVLLLGPATRLMEALHDLPKVYVATVAWGRETDTGDPGGKTTFEGDASMLSARVLEDVVTHFVGWHAQVPPTTSAKKIQGEPAYRRVHRGEEVQLPPSDVYLHTARWLSHDLPKESRLEIVCRGGFYVRALAREMGRRLGIGSHLRTLRRTQIGPWRDVLPGERVAVRGEASIPWCRRRLLSQEEYRQLRARRTIPLGTPSPPLYALPSGFPKPLTELVGIYQDRVVFLLVETAGVLSGVRYFPGGF